MWPLNDPPSGRGGHHNLKRPLNAQLRKASAIGGHDVTAVFKQRALEAAADAKRPARFQSVLRVGGSLAKTFCASLKTTQSDGTKASRWVISEMKATS